MVSVRIYLLCLYVLQQVSVGKIFKDKLGGFFCSALSHVIQASNNEIN